MGQKKINCPLCEWAAFERPDHKRSHMVSAEIQMYEHLKRYHKDEIEKRLRASGDEALGPS